MPPGPLYNWLCVLHTASDILLHAANIRGAQAVRANAEISSLLHLSVDNRAYSKRDAKRNASNRNDFVQTIESQQKLLRDTTIDPINTQNEAAKRELQLADVTSSDNSLNHFERTSQSQNEPSTSVNIKIQTPYVAQIPTSESSVSESGKEILVDDSFATLASAQNASLQYDLSIPESKMDPEVGVSNNVIDNNNEIVVKGTSQITPPEAHSVQRNLRPSRVPSTRIGRLFHYGGLAASLGYGAATEALRRASSWDSDAETSSLMMTPANISRLVEKLSRMRGAALKLGQFMSIQDSHLLPKDVEEIFRRVQDSAHYMPNWQMERVMVDSLGPSWASNFTSFEPIPFAAASLGQVHSAVLAAHVSPTGKDEKVAVKIQFPDIAKSIDNDLGYLKILLTAGKLLPKGLFLDKTISVMKGELVDECDYTREADCARLFASNEALGNDSRYQIPWVWNGSTSQVLVMQHMNGVSVGGNVVDTLSQETRDEIASRIVELCMKELFKLRMMQTDPNWTNFLWNEQTRQIELIDFGATRSYSKSFIDLWMHVLQAAVSEDRDACIRWSRELGYLTGEESETMLDAHVRSLTLLATPFRTGARDGERYKFGKGTEWARITTEIRSLIPVMLRERLTPPPRETYSLNRKLSGAFLLASRLSARVDCNGIWLKTVEKYRFDT